MKNAGALVEFRILGSVEVYVAGQRVDIGHARQRSVLAVLLLELNRVVPTERLIDRVWGESPPTSARNVVYGYVARLRAALADTDEPNEVLAHRLGGYLLEADREQLDACRFRRQTEQAAAAASDDERAAGLLRGAVGLWHGTALAGLDSPWLRASADALELQRIAAVLDLYDIELRQGRHEKLVSELTDEAAAHPGNERLIGQLMLALYRSGRQGEALRQFELARRQLAEEFGADPAPELRALHRRILRADLSLALPRSVARRAGDIPRELPTDIPAFTGRAAEFAELDRLLSAPAASGASADDAAADSPAGSALADRRAPAAVSVISGTAGAGKTALAVRWAHQVAESFPDGQLYVNLRGFDPGEPMSAMDALAGFLRALGVSGQDIPAEAAERAARYRSMLAGKRILVVLDNAGEVEQVRALLPGTHGCVAVVTSRDSLAGLVARDGARRLDLGLMPLADATGLLQALIGSRADSDPAAAAALAVQCSRLPLALRVVAELAVARSATPLADLVSELADGKRRLDLLDAGGDPRTAVRAVFSWSCQNLDADAARAFRLLGLHPGADLDPYAAAALTGTSVEQARRVLDLLARAHLIQPTGPARYGMPDLLRIYARELGAAQDSNEEGWVTLTRLFDHYLHTAAVAMDILFPAERHRRPRIPSPASPVPALTGLVGARAWLDAERANLAVVADAADHGGLACAIRLADTLFRYLNAGGHYREAVTIHAHARRAARRSGDRRAEATALTSLGLIDLREGRCHQATGHLREAAAVYHETGDRTGEARALTGLGLVGVAQRSCGQAADHYRQALALFTEIGDRAGETCALNNLGCAEERLGHCQQAFRHLLRGLALAREAGDRYGEAHALIGLGLVDLRQGRCQRAVSHLQRGLILARETGDRYGEAHALVGLGLVGMRQGGYQQATALYLQALGLFREITDRFGEVEALHGTGEVLLAAGQPGHSRAQHIAALGLASQAGNPHQQARAYNGLPAVTTSLAPPARHARNSATGG